MNNNKPLRPVLIFTFFFIFFAPSTALYPNDTATLTQFRLLVDVHATLHSNWTGTSACSAAWSGVRCSSDHRVIALSLPSHNLRGPINSLSSLNQLHLLDLHNNRLNGTLSPISNCTGLKLVYLDGNDFSGEIPPEIGFLTRLLRLDLSDNNIHGPIPKEITRLNRLLTLRLQNNALSGPIPDLSKSLVNLNELNLTNNELYGRLPEGLLKRFSYRSFVGNEGICGSTMLPVCSFTGATPSSDSDQTVSSNPSSLPRPPLIDKNVNKKGLSLGAIIGIIVANCVVILFITSFVVVCYCGKDYSSSKPGSYGCEKKVYAESVDTNSTNRSKLVFFDRKMEFELEELLKASAEMIGKGSLGTVYKAVLDDGCAMAVKRLKDANPCERKEFEQYMDVIGKIRDRNVVKLRAYYYAKEEKLLVYDYLPNGSLHSLLHGNRGPERIPLDWTTRISLVHGAAKGLAKIHEEYAAARIPHGNVKSSNILLDKNGVACISDFGLSLLLNPVHAIARLGGYRAPEQVEIKRLSQKADVYSFGVVLLEVLTGKAPTQYPSPSSSFRVEVDEQAVDLPKWVQAAVKEEWTAEVFDEELLRYKNIEEELVAMLQLGLVCVLPEPEKRPTMVEVVKMIEDIRVEQSPLGYDYDESRNSLSPSLATTDDGLAGHL